VIYKFQDLEQVNQSCGNEVSWHITKYPRMQAKHTSVYFLPVEDLSHKDCLSFQLVFHSAYRQGTFPTLVSQFYTQCVCVCVHTLHCDGKWMRSQKRRKSHPILVHLMKLKGS
jgi:hypothetical protein